MSRFTGKYDFCDEIEVFGLERILAARIFVGDENSPLQLKSLKDCVPYYPYVITAATYSKENGDTIWLTAESWIDIEEKRCGKIFSHDGYRELLRKEIEQYEETD